MQWFHDARDYEVKKILAMRRIREVNGSEIFELLIDHRGTREKVPAIKHPGAC